MEKRSPGHLRRRSGSFRAMLPGSRGNLGNFGNEECVTCRLHYSGDGSSPLLSAPLFCVRYRLLKVFQGNPQPVLRSVGTQCLLYALVTVQRTWILEDLGHFSKLCDCLCVCKTPNAGPINFTSRMPATAPPFDRQPNTIKA